MLGFWVGVGILRFGRRELVCDMQTTARFIVWGLGFTVSGLGFRASGGRPNSDFIPLSAFCRVLSYAMCRVILNCLGVKSRGTCRHGILPAPH